jgi:hypothetical protein
MASESEEQVQKNFQVLSGIASSLNTASDELTQAVGFLDEALKKLNIGLCVWVTFRDRSDRNSPEIYDYDQIGYCKVNGTWGIAIQKVWGDASIDEHDAEGPWLFTDAPREMRIQAVDDIPGLIEALGKKASETQIKIQEKAKQVRELANVIRADTHESKTTVSVKGISRQQFTAITAILAKQHKFVGEIVQQANRWEREGDTLRIYFAPNKRAFGEMINDGRGTLLKFHSAVQQVLGSSIQVGVQLEQQLTGSGKVQK